MDRPDNADLQLDVMYDYRTNPHAFQKDLPQAEVHVLDAGHFALETHGPEIAGLILDFLGRKLSA